MWIIRTLKSNYVSMHVAYQIYSFFFTTLNVGVL